MQNSSKIRFLTHDEVVRNDAVVVRPDGGGGGGGSGSLLALVVEVARYGVRGAVDVGVVGGLVLGRFLASVRRLGQRIRLVRVAPVTRRSLIYRYVEKVEG